MNSRQDLVGGNVLNGSIVSDGTLSYTSFSVQDGNIAIVDRETVDMGSEDNSFNVSLASPGRTTLKAVCYGATGDYLGDVDLFVGVMG